MHLGVIVEEGDEGRLVVGWSDLCGIELVVVVFTLLLPTSVGEKGVLNVPVRKNVLQWRFL